MCVISEPELRDHLTSQNYFDQRRLLPEWLHRR